MKTTVNLQVFLSVPEDSLIKRQNADVIEHVFWMMSLTCEPGTVRLAVGNRLRCADNLSSQPANAGSLKILLKFSKWVSKSHKVPPRMHQNSPFSDKKIKKFRGGSCPHISPQQGRGHPLPTPHPHRRLRRSTQLASTALAHPSASLTSNYLRRPWINSNLHLGDRPWAVWRTQRLVTVAFWRLVQVFLSTFSSS